MMKLFKIISHTKNGSSDESNNDEKRVLSQSQDDSLNPSDISQLNGIVSTYIDIVQDVFIEIEQNGNGEAVIDENDDRNGSCY